MHDGRVAVCLMGSTVKVRMKTSIAGSLMARRGQVVSCSHHLAARLIATNQAEPVREDIETAMTATPETATEPRARARGKRGRRG